MQSKVHRKCAALSPDSIDFPSVKASRERWHDIKEKPVQCSESDSDPDWPSLHAQSCSSDLSSVSLRFPLHKMVLKILTMQDFVRKFK